MPAIPPMPARDHGSIPPLPARMPAPFDVDPQLQRQFPRATAQPFDDIAPAVPRRLLIVDENWW